MTLVSHNGATPELDDGGAGALAVWKTFDLLSSPPELEALIERTVEALLASSGARRVALWRPIEGAWTLRASVDADGRRQVDPTEDEVAIVERASKTGETFELRLDSMLWAIACANAGETLAVLIFVHPGRETSPAEVFDVAALRALGGRMGRVLKSVELLEGVGRNYQHTQERLRLEAIELRNLLRKREGLLGSDEKMRDVMRAIERTARTNLPVLLSGETGTGKEAAARLIHRLSGRSGPFVVVDCGAIPQQLLESELFGYERGAFTGAEGRRIGRFEEANRGTLFLDELGELPLLLQPKLLRVLQESTLRRIGGDREIELDLRVVAATNRDLSGMVSRGSFREDLFFRLSVVEIGMPPLRERGEDVLLLTIYFLRQYCAEVGRDLMSISAEAHHALLNHPWPGNVRELQNRVRRAVVMGSGPELTVADLQLVPGNSDTAVPIKRSAKPRPRSGSGAGAATFSAPPMAAAPQPILPRTSTPLPLARATSVVAVAQGEEKIELEEAVAEWFWQAWANAGPDAPPPQDCIEAFLLRAALQVADGSLRRAAALLSMHVDTFGTHLERLGHPTLSRTVRGHRLSKVLEQTLSSGTAAGDPGLIDRTLAVVLRELLVYCHGNKSEMARILGWGRRTLWRHFRKLGISSAEMS